MTTTPNTSTTTIPTHKLYRVLKGRTQHDKSIWTEVAACWPYKDGNGWNVKFRFNETPAAGAEYVMRRERLRGIPREV